MLLAPFRASNGKKNGEVFKENPKIWWRWLGYYCGMDSPFLPIFRIRPTFAWSPKRGWSRRARERPPPPPPSSTRPIDRHSEEASDRRSAAAAAARCGQPAQPVVFMQMPKRHVFAAAGSPPPPPRSAPLWRSRFSRQWPAVGGPPPPPPPTSSAARSR